MKFHSLVRHTVCAGTFILGLNAASQAQAVTFTVTNTDDSGVGSLRQAITEANNSPTDDTIAFELPDVGGPNTITLASELPINNNGTLLIIGPGRSKLTLSGGDTTRIFVINPGANMTLKDCRITGARLSAITSYAGILAVDNLDFYSNTAATNAGGSGFGGAIYNVGGTVSAVNSTFKDNTTGGSGGGGGAIQNGGLLSVSRCAFLNNTASLGGAISNSGGTATIENSTFSANTGSAVDNANGNLNIESSTFTQNSSPNGFGGAIFNSSGPLTLNNSILASNTAGSGPNIFGTVSSGEYNLIDDTSSATIPGTHNIIGQDPKLGSLISNDGRTPYFPLLPGSPAIDAGNTFLTQDQIGNTRPFDNPSYTNAEGGNGSDIGAAELPESFFRIPNYTINSTDDHDDGVCGFNDCTLREAIRTANFNFDANTIRFDPTLFASKRTLNLIGGLPPITGNLTIIGPNTKGAGITLRLPTDRPSADMLRVLSGTVNISNLAFTGIESTGLNIFGGVVNVDSCTFTRCAYGIQNGGDALKTATLTATNCTFFSNATSALFNSSGGTVTSTLNFCTFASNVRAITIQGNTVNLSNSIVQGTSQNIQNLGGTLNSNNNLISSTPGFDPNGLKDNGGPTPTVALVAGSPAINTGTGTLNIDQRGVLRDSQPDRGAVELNNAPSVVSVTPQGAIDNVGTKRTFAITVSDSNGVSDIQEAWLLINDRLSWNGGATFIYVPNPSSPATGLLYMRSGDTFLPPIPVGTTSRATLDNGFVRVVARDVSVALGSDGRSLTIYIPLTPLDPLVGVNRVFGRVVDIAGATDSASLPGDGGYIRSGNYTVRGQFANEVNKAPSLSKLTPTTTNSALSTEGIGPVQQFSFFAKDEDGTGDIESVWFMAGKQRNWKNSSTFIYTPRTRQLYLRSDDGNTNLGGGVIGTQGIIENSQVRVDLSKVRVLTYGDGKTLGFILPIQAKRGLLGQNKVWLRAQDSQRATALNGDEQGYVQSGTWNVAQGTPPRSTTSNSLSASDS